jgi:hypothetical protein
MLFRTILLLLILLLPSTTVFAYSYGDPNKEELAETYKEIAAKLNSDPPDWTGAYQAYASKKNEIALEFGNKVTQTLENNFANKEKNSVLHNYKAVLVLNIERRLQNADKQFDDYAKAKLLLAKGRGTFNVLSPYVDGAVSAKVYAAFDQALTSLGNPGLFGVGAVPADKQAFQTQVRLIRTTLAPLFPLKTAQINDKPKSESATKPTPQQPTKKAPAGQQKATASAAKETQPVASQSASQPATGQHTEVQQQATEAPQATASSAVVPVQPVQEIANQGPATSTAQAEQTKPAQSASATASGPQPSASSSAESAAPTTSKVNPVVTVSVIGGMALVIGTLFWIGRRKGFI